MDDASTAKTRTSNLLIFADAATPLRFFGRGDPMLARMDRWLQKWPKWAIVAASLGSLALIGTGDYLTGTDYLPQNGR